MSTYQVLNFMFETLVVSLKNLQLDFLFYSPAAYSVIRKMLLLLLRIPKGARARAPIENCKSK